MTLAETEEKYEKMTTMPVEKLVWELAVPSIVTMMISALYNMAATYFVSSLGTSATAAVGVTFSVMALIQAVGFFFGHGSGNFISRALGAKDTGKASRMAATGFFSAFLAGILIAAAGNLFLTPLARFLGATETILPYARQYMRIILLGAPFMASSLMLNNLLRFQGSAFYGMIGMVSGAVLNIALTPLFIFTLHQGIQGAALATLLSQAFSCLLLLIGCSRGGNVTIKLKNFSPSSEAYGEIFRGGVPSLLRQGLASLGTIVMNQAAGIFGDAAIAAMTIVNRTAMMAGSALIGFGQGFQPVCGFNYGAKLYGRVRQAFWYCFKISTAALTVTAVVSFIFAPDIIGLFRSGDENVLTVGTAALRYQCLTFPLLGWITLNNMMLQTMGKALSASILAMARQGLFLIPFLLVLTPRFHLTGVEIAVPLSDFCTFLLAIPLGCHVLQQMKEAQEEKIRV